MLKITGVIYGLYDPRNGEIRYIGQTISPNLRLTRHISDAKHKSFQYPVYRWIRKLLKENISPEMEIIEFVDRDQLNSLEIFYISKAKELGWNLVNVHKGGAGGTSHRTSVETRVKMSESRKANPNFNTYIEILAELRKRKVICNETNIIYESCRDAARQLNLHEQHIAAIARGKSNRKTTGGLSFTFVPKSVETR